MMKRRNIIMVMMTSLLLGSCSSEDILSVPNGNGRIRFDVGVSQSQEVMEMPISTSPMTCGNDTLYAHSAALRNIELHNDVTSKTRGKEVDNSSFPNNFGLYGYTYNSDQSWKNNGSELQPTIKNEQITKGDTWTSSTYLPGQTKKMALFAYAPYIKAGIPVNAEISVADGKGAPQLTYTIDSDVSKQVDLLVANSLDVVGNTSSVALDFKHALTAVKFSVGTIIGFTKITKIMISGVKNNGTLSLDGGNWKLNESTASYTIKDIDLSSASGDITGSSTDDLLLLMPQTLPSGAKLEVTMANDIGTKTFSTDLTGEWKKGYTVTYLLSVDRVAGEFHFEVTPSTTSIPKEGGDIEMKVKSYYQIADGGAQVPIPWSGTYKIGSNQYTLSGDGSVDNDIRKISVPENNEALSHKSLLQFINYTDPDEPHDLSIFDGKQSTANCYVVQGCGWFKLPLVYGNGITKGKTAGQGAAAASNTFGYNQSSSFMNHKGDAIYNLSNAPYINGNGYDPNTAEVVWESISGLIKNPTILDGNYLKFYVDPAMVDQANAVIAVKFGETIVWSWHLWFTASSWTATYTYGSNNFMTMPLGFIDSSGSGTATPRTLPFTFNQVISSGKTTTVLVSQNGVSSTGGTCTFYQWGRKEPFPGATENNQETDNIPSEPYYYSSILNPRKFIIGSSNSPYNYNWFNGEFYDLWNIGNSSLDNTTSISKKTIYDPSPVGFKVPPPATFTAIGLSQGIWNSTSGQEGIKVTTTGDFWRIFGYLQSTSGSSKFVGERGFYWSCGPMPNSGSSRYGCAMDFTSNYVYSQTSHYLAHGLSVRPVSEQQFD